MTVADLMTEAESSKGEIAIRMTEADGHASDFLALPIGDDFVWLHTWTDHHKSHTIDRRRVRSRLETRWPDVELLAEPKSLFSDLREDDE